METIIVNSDGTHTNERTGKTLPPQPSEHHEYDAKADLWIAAATSFEELGTIVWPVQGGA